LLSLSLPVPPIEERDKITAILSSWDHAIEKLQSLISAKEQHKKGLMQQLLSGKKRFPGFEDEWKEVKLGDIFTERKETNRPDLKLLAITSKQGVIDRDNLEKRDTSNEDKSKYKRIAPGDIGYNTMRLWQGVAALSPVEGIISPAYTVVTPNEEIDGEYMSYLFKYPPMIHLFYRYSQGLVSDTWNCKFSHFSQIKIKIPGKAEQEKIASVFKAVDRELITYKQKLKALQTQKKGLMQQLLTGKIRVKAEECV
jgi:type I restriction enzyme, S subunit